MIGSENIGDIARDLAKEIYEQSKRALMAHSVRAVKEHLRAKHRINHYTIVIRQLTGIQSRYARNSWVVFGQRNATILVDQSLEHDETRVCIAHELFHVLYSFERSTADPKRNRGRLMEDACDVFANELCELHNAFYQDGETILRRCRFHNLPIYSIPKRDRDP